MLAQPGTTAYDLRFRLLGVPIRVHPLFWLVSLMLGGAAGADLSDRREQALLLIWVAVVFVSILGTRWGTRWRRSGRGSGRASCSTGWAGSATASGTGSTCRAGWR